MNDDIKRAKRDVCPSYIKICRELRQEPNADESIRHITEVYHRFGKFIDALRNYLITGKNLTLLKTYPKYDLSNNNVLLQKFYNQLHHSHIFVYSYWYRNFFRTLQETCIM